MRLGGTPGAPNAVSAQTSLRSAHISVINVPSADGIARGAAIDPAELSVGANAHIVGAQLNSLGQQIGDYGIVPLHRLDGEFAVMMRQQNSLLPFSTISTNARFFA